MLLAVFVPMLALSSLHIHEQTQRTADSCTECVEHHCGGHLAQQSIPVHACVICQFLTLTFMAATVVAVLYLSTESKIQFAQRQCVVHLDACGIPTLRAPPCV